MYTYVSTYVQPLCISLLSIIEGADYSIPITTLPRPNYLGDHTAVAQDIMNNIFKSIQAAILNLNSYFMKSYEQGLGLSFNIVV